LNRRPTDYETTHGSQIAEKQDHSDRFGVPADSIAAEVEQVSERVSSKRSLGGPSEEIAFTSSLGGISRFIILPIYRERIGAVRREVL
jgi:hypothetical protein